MVELKKILILFEDGKIRKESIAYGIELGRRMDCSLCVLMLMEGTEKGNSSIWESVLNGAIKTIDDEGIGAECGIRYGDKTSEFLKFLAVGPYPSAIVWGSNAGVITERGRKPGHWFTRVAENVGCPVVSPTIKKK
ncbi:hypothetical protein PITCH_A140066 [uncultured Desulfobacterium sp.]|uniref:UspA domain-containing protein n=1 Tax=uncultured Desulfobacterium sp. TaxID=201089 RepID=A0A445MSZ9_9BACT|nr:hypothetical protein PITCH_A140066 [uncultured Desulfobacterium sp.]